LKIEISPEETRNLEALLGNPDLMVAFKKWHKRLNHQTVSSGKALNLSPEAWAACSRQLLKTGWFTAEEEGLTPNQSGNDFLYGATELQLAHTEKKAGYDQIESILSNLPCGPAVDIGCGIGLLLVMLARQGFGPLYGYDLTKSQLMMAATLLSPFTVDAILYQKDATPLTELEDASVAMVVARGSLHYFNQSRLAATLKRVLQPGGHLLTESIGPSFYGERIFSRDISVNSPRRRVSYCRTVIRTWIYMFTGKQPLLGAKAPEIAWSHSGILRFAHMSGLEVVNIRPAPTLHGYLVLLHKP
jgi:ubiquinone/menaquinone biosynthesis C-methylase UbiE